MSAYHFSPNLSEHLLTDSAASWLNPSESSLISSSARSYLSFVNNQLKTDAAKRTTKSRQVVTLSLLGVLLVSFLIPFLFEPSSVGLPTSKCKEVQLVLTSFQGNEATCSEYIDGHVSRTIVLPLSRVQHLRIGDTVQSRTNCEY